MNEVTEKVKLNIKFIILGLCLPLIGMFISGFFTDTIKARSIRKGSALMTLILIAIGFVIIFIIAGISLGNKYAK